MRTTTDTVVPYDGCSTRSPPGPSSPCRAPLCSSLSPPPWLEPPERLDRSAHTQSVCPSPSRRSTSALEGSRAAPGPGLHHTAPPTDATPRGHGPAVSRRHARGYLDRSHGDTARCG